MPRSKFKLAKNFISAVILSGLLFIGSRLYASPEPSVWFSEKNPEFTISSSIISDAEYPSTYAQRGNVDCSNLSFTKRDGDTIPFLLAHRESQQSGCYISTAVGPVDTNGFINVSGTDYIAETVRADNSPLSFFSFPNSDVFVSNASGSPAIGTYVWFDHIQTSLIYSKDNYGRIRAVISPKSQMPLLDKAGNKLPVMSDNFGVSENGQWAIVDSPGRAVLRINLDTMEVLPFTDSFELGNGIGAAIRTAVSGDGRYAVVASKNYAYFRIFDLSTCSAVPNTITSPVSCQSRELNTFARSKIVDMGGILQIRFMSNNLLRIYASYGVSNGSKIGQFALAAPGTSLQGMDYMALGDSFSSGEGSYKYEIGTDEKGVNMCHLSTVSYPHIIAKALKLNSFHSVACSGATTFNLTGGSGISNDKTQRNRDNQYSFLPAQDSLGYWLPGYDKQIKFVSENAPRIITASAIGNDLGFDDIVVSCVMPGTCYPTYEDRVEVFNQVDAKLPVLVTMYKKLKSAAPPDAKIFAVGYPQVASSIGSCGLNVHLNQSELTFASSLITRIDTVVKTAAAQAGVNYADVEDALTGYRLCEVNAGNIAVNGLTAGKDAHFVIGNESYHPNEFGQFLMAQKILGSTNSLSLGGLASQNTSLPILSTSEPALSNTPKTNRPINKRLIFMPDSQVLSSGQSLSAQLNGLSYGLPANTKFTIMVDGITSGSATTDLLGNLTLNTPLPTTGGIYIIDAVGIDVTGQPVDIAAVIFVDTNTQSCGPVIISGQDIDRDGIDDSCDAFIGPAPIAPNTDINISPTASGSLPPSANAVNVATTPLSNNNDVPITFIDEVITDKPTSTITTPQTTPSKGDTEVTPKTGSVTHTPSPAAASAEKDSSEVLGESTKESLRPSIKNIASDSQQLLATQIAREPLRYILVLLAIISALIILAFQYAYEQRHKRIYAVLSRHRMHV